MLILSIVFSKLCMLACYHTEIHIFSGQFDWIIFEGVVPCFLLNISSKVLYQKLLTCLIWILQNFTCLLIICRFTYHYDSFINSFLMELLLFLADITVWREPKGQMRFCSQLASVVCILFKNLMKSLYQFEPHLFVSRSEIQDDHPPWNKVLRKVWRCQRIIIKHKSNDS